MRSPRGALHSVGTGSKAIVLLSRNSVSATLSKTGLRTTRPCFLSLSLTKAGVSLRRHPFQTYLVEIATAEHFIPLGRARSLHVLFCSRGTLFQPPSVKQVSRTTRPCFLSLSLTKAGVSLRRHPFQTYLVEIANAEHFIPLGWAPSLLFCSRGTACSHRRMNGSVLGLIAKNAESRRDC